MLNINRPIQHQSNPTLTSVGSNTEPGNPPVAPISATPAKSGGIASHFGLYGAKKRLPTPPTISHKNHRHIDDSARAEIRTIDQKIKAAFSHPDKASFVAAILTELLDKPFFQPLKHIPGEEMVKLFAELDDCPINPEDGETKRYAEKFVHGYTALQEKYIPEAEGIADEKKLEKTIEDYLKTNRSTKASFETKFVSTLNVDSSSRGSAQKMALETFTKIFPLTKSNDKNHLNVLKKLIDTLPNLEHHAIIERNAQRRGLHVLEEALGSLPSNDVAEILVHLMDRISDLSQKLSKRKAYSVMEPVIKTVPPLALGSVPVALVATGAVAALPFMAIPVGTAFLVRAGESYFGIEKQPQGTALYMLKDQLTKLRKDWGNVTPANQQQLTDAFKKLKSSYTELLGTKRLGTKKSTLQRVFNDSFIDPSKFPAKPELAVELPKRLRHNFIAPITSRWAPVPHSVRGYATATLPQKELVDLLIHYHNEAKRAGALNTKFPAGFLENFIEKTRAPEFENAVDVVRKSFDRVMEMVEYKSQNGKVRLLSRIVEMTNRLAVGDEIFVQAFASTCELANADCHNNARQIFKALIYSVIADKALKGEDGLNDNGNLLTLGRSFFHEQELKAATREVITHNEETPLSPDTEIEVEVGNAVEIALGRKFGIPAPIQGMGYTDSVTELVTPEKLKSIQDNIEKRISNKEAFIDFLMRWTPLTKKITEHPVFKKNVEKKIPEEYDKFGQAQDAYFEIEGIRTDAQEMAFEAAAIVCQSAASEAATDVLRETVQRLVDSHTPGRALGDDAMFGSVSANTNMTNSAHAGNEIQEMS